MCNAASTTTHPTTRGRQPFPVPRSLRCVRRQLQILLRFCHRLRRPQPELDDRELNRAIERAELVTEAEPRARAWAKVNHRVVDLAPAIPFMWDYVPAISSADVRGVQNGYTAGWDLNFTSLR